MVTKSITFFKRTSQKGFSLMEVMIAITIFATFVAVYVTTEGYNISDSTLMREEIQLQDLCEQIINELITDPPEFSEALLLTAKTKTFEDNDNYEYTIKYTAFKVPDISGEDEDDNSYGEDGATAAIQKKLMEQVTKNMEKLIWQVEITVTNKATGFNHSLSTWLLNEEHQVTIEKF